MTEEKKPKRRVTPTLVTPLSEMKERPKVNGLGEYDLSHIPFEYHACITDCINGDNGPQLSPRRKAKRDKEFSEWEADWIRISEMEEDLQEEAVAHRRATKTREENWDQVIKDRHEREIRKLQSALETKKSEKKAHISARNYYKKYNTKLNKVITRSNTEIKNAQKEVVSFQNKIKSDKSDIPKLKSQLREARSKKTPTEIQKMVTRLNQRIKDADLNKKKLKIAKAKVIALKKKKKFALSTKRSVNSKMKSFHQKAQQKQKDAQDAQKSIKEARARHRDELGYKPRKPREKKPKKKET